MAVSDQVRSAQRSASRRNGVRTARNGSSIHSQQPALLDLVEAQENLGIATKQTLLQALLEAVPVLDVTLSEAELAVVLHKAAVESGFFYVKNHGITQELLAAMFDRSRAFFSLPMEDKMRIHVNKWNKGYTKLDGETLDPNTQKQPDGKEFCGIGLEVDPSEYDHPLHGPNQFPSEDLVPGYKQAMLSYFHACLTLTRQLMRLLALSLNLDAAYFDEYLTTPVALLRPLHYTPAISKPDEGIFGAGAHSDYGLITILATDDVPGLQVHIQGTWVTVPPKPGHLIINLADLLHRWTNGAYKSALHRVVSTSGQHRYSTAFFVDPNFDTVVEPLPTCCSPSNPPRWLPVTSGDYLLAKYRQTQPNYAETERAMKAKGLQPPVVPEGTQPQPEGIAAN